MEGLLDGGITECIGSFLIHRLLIPERNTPVDVVVQVGQNIRLSRNHLFWSSRKVLKWDEMSDQLLTPAHVGEVEEKIFLLGQADADGSRVLPLHLVAPWLFPVPSCTLLVPHA